MARRTYPYHPFITDWMRKVEQAQIPACREQKLLMPFIREILDNKNIEFRANATEEAVLMLHRNFPFKMHDYQLFRFAIFYGLYEKGTEYPVFNENFNLWGRGTGKNGTASMDSMYLTSEYNGVRKYDVDVVANSEKQATTSFNEVYDILESNPKKYKQLYRWNLQKIYNKATQSTLGYLTSNAKTKDGGRQGAIIFDEVHEYQNYDLITVLEGGLGKVAKPRIIYLTTDGSVRDAVIDDLKRESLEILTGETPHNGRFPFIFKMDNIQEFGKPDLFVKAIPRLRYDETLRRQVMKEYANAKNIEDKKEKFILKRLNLAYASKEKTVTTWESLMQACSHVWPSMGNSPCIGAVDFAELRDFCSVGLIFKRNGMHYYKEHTFIHAESLKLKDYKINVEELVKDGFVTIVSGDPVISPRVIVDWFKTQAKTYHVKKVYADRFKFVALKEEFEKAGLELVGVPNGTVTHSLLAPIITSMFANGTIAFENNKLMRWYIWNVAVRTDKKGNKSYEKIEPILRKTDGFFSFLHGLIATELNDELKEADTGVLDLGLITL